MGSESSPAFRILCEWAANASGFSPVACRRAEDGLVDILATMIAGIRDASTASVVNSLTGCGEGASLAFGAPHRFAAPWAALINGTAAHALDFDDNFAPAFTHATAVLAPGLLALVDDRQVDGPSLLDAFIVGLELQGRIGRLMQPAHYQRGWHSTSTIGAIGTAGACARLLGGSPAHILAAMSASTSMAGGSKLQFGSMMKPIHAGLAAKNAVLAARFAMAGIGGNDDPLVGDWGFAALTGAGNAAPEIMLAGLGETLEIETSGLLAKRFPCCGAVHRSIDALEILLREPGLSLEAIDRIETSLPEMARRNLRFDCPADELEARFSGTYCMARMLVDGSVGLSHFTATSVRDERIAAWLPRIRLIAYDNAMMVDGGNFEASVRIYLKNGKVMEASVSHPKGSPENPLSDGDLLAKFRTCCAWSGHEAVAEPLFQLARSLGRAHDVGDVMASVERNLRVH
ncbi:MmgE/PrpD family protein [Rhizobium sp. NTR19]|uniref:MmgE/PrpD family protein n=1 Tax=Neorhizobium turbinariae TaxID=2937795 RepID=A0ABT0IWI7_9HYPH|nr:MmgE/PrpD family protein [Neorhizobium turbinariae]MCK8782249.1 MmgE/PrpD family protein [Neorhizobium turbinariae]